MCRSGIGAPQWQTPQCLRAASAGRRIGGRLSANLVGGEEDGHDAFGGAGGDAALVRGCVSAAAGLAAAAAEALFSAKKPKPLRF